MILSPKARPENAPGVLWIHGGGYVLGMKEMVHMGRAVSLVKKFGAVVIAPGYRLAFQAPYPAAIKEDMFAALVEPACEGLLALFRQEATDQKQFIGTGDLSTWENGSDAKLAVSYIYDHLDAFRLTICKSQGTKYESFLHDLAVLEEETTLSFMKLLKNQGVQIKDLARRNFIF